MLFASLNAVLQRTEVFAIVPRFRDNVPEQHHSPTNHNVIDEALEANLDEASEASVMFLWSV
jgi:hypothetical protein